ncbi:PAS domain S-box protein [Methanoculleus taiwanensis]|uniref:PAS domain S-box protein n=1 Tax=Methanoculleus taiwanensis TaxID=1550565 RepID=UPI000FFE40B7|nr:PAS domain S-box protein [Methanoculleus taiwanensis]
MSTQSPSDAILIIDDDPARSGTLAGYLTGHGFKVLVAGNDEAGIRIARDAHPALILLDVSMPDMDGFETCRRLKADETTRDIPVICIIPRTATEEEKKTGFHAGAADYVTRPFQHEEVLARVTTHLRLRSMIRELREADARLRVLIDKLPIEFWALDSSLRYTMQNAVSRAHFGDVVGRRIEDLGLPPKVAALWLEQDERVLRGEVLRGEYERTLAGEKRAYENLVAPVSVDGTVVGIVGVALDVTDCKRAEEARESALAELRELETIINRSPAVVFLWRAVEGWPVEYVSGNVTQFGYTPADFMSGRILYARIIHPDDHERVAAEVSRYSREGRDKFVQEYRIITASGEVLWLDDRTWIRRDPDGTITHYQGIVIDITERRRAEEALQKARDELEHRVAERTAELARANRMLNILSACNQAVVRATEEPALLREICRIIVDVGDYPLVWIGFAEEDAARTVCPVAQSGFEDGYLDTAEITWADTERGRGPTSTAIRSGRPSIARDVRTDPNFAPWREEAIRRGYASSIALPLQGEGRVFGALNIYAAAPDAFHAEEVRLLEELTGDLAFGITSLRERTERRRAEKALRESEVRYRSLVELMPDAVIVHQDGTIVYVNPAGVRIGGGKSPEDFVGKPVYLFVHPDYRDHVAGQIRQMHQEGRGTPPFEERLLTVDGRPIDVEITAAPIHYQGLPSTLVVFRDITERKQAEDELRKTHRRLESTLKFIETVFSAVPIPFFYKDRDGRYIRVNDAFADVMGFTPDYYKGKTVMELWPGELAEMYHKKDLELMENPEKQIYEFHVRDKNGVIRPVIYGKNVFYDENGQIAGIVGAFQDITERKQAEDALHRHARDLARLHQKLQIANREANLYLDILTHDIGNTENVSNLYADLLIGSLEGEAVGYVKKLQRSIQKSIEILRTVSTIRRIHRESPELKPMDLDAVIRKVTEDFPGSTIHYEGAHQPIMADDLLSVVFTNLIGNAVKFGGPGVEIAVRVDERDGEVLVSVEDTGQGVPDDEKYAIFHRYEQQKRGVGEGLGLYLVQILIERYDGKVWVDDRVPGHPEEGAAFRLTLRSAPDRPSRPGEGGT